MNCYCFCELQCILIAEQRKRKHKRVQQCSNAHIHTRNVGSGFIYPSLVAKSISTHFPVTVCLMRPLHVCQSKRLPWQLWLSDCSMTSQGDGCDMMHPQVCVFSMVQVSPSILRDCTNLFRGMSVSICLS